MDRAARLTEGVIESYDVLKEGYIEGLLKNARLEIPAPLIERFCLSGIARVNLAVNDLRRGQVIAERDKAE